MVETRVISRVGVVNHGSGNIGSIVNMLAHIGADPVVVSSPDELTSVQRLILPGVGTFDHGMQSLQRAGFVQPLRDWDSSRRPLLGICLGMQMLMDSSDEGSEPGLGLIPGKVRRFIPAGLHQKVPHMGWNTVSARTGTALARQAAGSRYYFVHSYHVEVENASDCAGETHYIRNFCSALDNGSGIFGYQFHPEKSHYFGMALLRDFAGSDADL